MQYVVMLLKILLCELPVHNMLHWLPVFPLNQSFSEFFMGGNQLANIKLIFSFWALISWSFLPLIASWLMISGPHPLWWSYDEGLFVGCQTENFAFNFASISIQCFSSIGYRVMGSAAVNYRDCRFYLVVKDTLKHVEALSCLNTVPSRTHGCTRTVMSRIFAEYYPCTLQLGQDFMFRMRQRWTCVVCVD